MRRLWQDLRFGARMLAKNPTFAFLAVVVLALGIGANTAIFSVIDASLLRDLPFEDSERIVIPASINVETNVTRSFVSYPDYLDWREQENVFERVAVINSEGFDISGEGEPENIPGLSVSEDYFSLMRAAPVLGRLFLPDDYRQNEDIIVISAGLWKRRFGESTEVIGKRIRLTDYRQERSFTVVGVVDADSVWPSDTRVWIPLSFGSPLPSWVMERDNFFLRAIARLRPDVEMARAQSRVSSIAQRVAQELPAKRAGWDIELIPLREWIVGPQQRQAMFVMFGAVGFVLLIACVNVANLLLVRATARQREVAVRMSLGAGRLDLVRQMLTESVVLALLAGGFGVALARWAMHFILAFVPPEVGLETIAIDARALLFSLSISLLAALIFGSIPALATGNSELAESLKASARSLTSERHTRRLRGAMVVSEIALSLVLLVGAGLMLRSFITLIRSDPGIRMDQLLSLGVHLPKARYPEKPQRDAFLQQLLNRLEKLPGVRAACAMSVLPLGGGGMNLGRAFVAEGKSPPPQGSDRSALWTVVTPGYFKTLGIPVLRGRAFSDRDRPDSVPTIIINEILARQMFADEDPVGRHMKPFEGDVPLSHHWDGEGTPREIIGVVGNVRQSGMVEGVESIVYVPYQQVGWPLLGELVVRSVGSPLDVVSQLKSEVWELDRNLPVSDIRTMEEILAGSVGREQRVTVLLSFFAGVALLLAAVGIYGIVSYGARQRTQEIGVRMALGAQRVDVLRLVLAQGLVLTSIGIVVGLAAAVAVTRVLTNLLYEISSTDAVTYGAVSLLLVLVSVVAGLVPALRAVRLHPVTALRYE